MVHKFVKDYVDYKILLWLSTTFPHIHIPTHPCLRLIFGDSYVLSVYNINKDDPEVQIPRYLPLRKDPINKDHQEVQIPRPRDLRWRPLRKDSINKDHQALFSEDGDAPNGPTIDKDTHRLGDTEENSDKKREAVSNTHPSKKLSWFFVVL